MGGTPTLRMMASASFLQAARSRVRVLTMMESVSPYITCSMGIQWLPTNSFRRMTHVPLLVCAVCLETSESLLPGAATKLGHGLWQ
jgi:hypothetical protein